MCWCCCRNPLDKKHFNANLWRIRKIVTAREKGEVCAAFATYLMIFTVFTIIVLLTSKLEVMD